MMSNKLQNLTVKQKIYGYTTAGFLLIAGLIYLAALPAANSIKKAKDEIISKKVELEDLLAKNEKLADLNEQIKKIQPDLDSLDRIYVNPNRELEFITVLEETARKNNVEQTINILPQNLSESSQAIIPQPINIIVSGPFSDTVNYLRDIQKISYYLTVESVNFNKSSAGGNIAAPADKNVQLSINAEAYWKKYEKTQ